MNRFVTFIALVAISLSVVAQQNFTPDTKLRMAAQIIDNFYVEDVDNDTIVTEGIKAMLKTLDPHSAYTSPSETKEFTQPLEGKFSGIGIQFNMLDDTVYVIQTVSGGPSQKVGIMPGDRIISANDTVLAGKKMINTQVMKHLRGPKGSVVDLRVKRATDTIDFRVVRDDIPLYSVDETFMAGPTTGYIRITRFAEETGNEVRSAIERLKARGMKNLIIDLSDNGGGYLGAAFDVAGEFLPIGTPVVSTEGRRQPKKVFVTDREPSLPDGRVVVIANQFSASAAEILSGALQDNDRGLIVGRRTFGKGLVQRPFPFPDGSMIRLTVSRYYTPSGRCIQKHYDKGHSEEYQLDVYNRLASGELWSADSIRRDETMRYETLNNHRPVYGGGGIIPDLFVPADTSYYSVYYRTLVARGLINRTAVTYVDTHRAELAAQYPDNVIFQQNFTVPRELIDQLLAAAEAAGIEFKEDQWQRSLPLVEAILKGLVARDLFEDGSYYQAIASLIPDYVQALELINDTEHYNSLLQGK